MSPSITLIVSITSNYFHSECRFGEETASFSSSDHLLDSLLVFGYSESPPGWGREAYSMDAWIVVVLATSCNMLAVGVHESEAFEGHTAKKML